MYTYYFLTAFKPELKQSFWWKKHITQVQLVSHYDISCDLDQNRPPLQIQFFILMFHFGLPLLYKDCAFPKFVLFCGLIQNVFMFILFSDFYNKAYRKKPPAPPISKKAID